jgi:hypothetical protein
MTKEQSVVRSSFNADWAVPSTMAADALDPVTVTLEAS